MFILTSVYSNVIMSFDLSFLGPSRLLGKLDLGFNRKPRRSISRAEQTAQTLNACCASQVSLSLNLFLSSSFVKCLLIVLPDVFLSAEMLFSSSPSRLIDQSLSWFRLKDHIHTEGTSGLVCSVRWSFAAVGKCLFVAKREAWVEAIKADVIVCWPEEGTLSGLGTS